MVIWGEKTDGEMILHEIDSTYKARQLRSFKKLRYETCTHIRTLRRHHS